MISNTIQSYKASNVSNEIEEPQPDTQYDALEVSKNEKQDEEEPLQDTRIDTSIISNEVEEPQLGSEHVASDLSEEEKNEQEEEPEQESEFDAAYLFEKKLYEDYQQYSEYPTPPPSRKTSSSSLRGLGLGFDLMVSISAKKSPSSITDNVQVHHLGSICTKWTATKRKYSPTLRSFQSSG